MSDHATMLYHSQLAWLHKAKHGVFASYKNDDPIGTCVKYYGEWAEQEFDVIDQLINPTSNCLDIGANIGTHTVALSKKCIGGFVFAFEPQFNIYQALNTNIFLNDCVNVIPYNVGISNTIQSITARINNPGITHSINYGEFKINEESEYGIEIKCVKIDEVELYDKAIDFIKLDVEEHEVSALMSGERVITTGKPHMYIEYNSHDGNDELLRTMDSLGYNCYWHVYPKHNPNNFNNKPNIWITPDMPATLPYIDKYFEGNMVAIHRSKDDGKFKEPIDIGFTFVDYLLSRNLIKEI
jgi:FkbM family methyltransferase